MGNATLKNATSDSENSTSPSPDIESTVESTIEDTVVTKLADLVEYSSAPPQVFDSVGTDSEYVALRHPNMDNVVCDDKLRILMFDASKESHGRHNLYSSFLSASPRRNRPMTFREPSTGTHQRRILIDGKPCVLDIDEISMHTSGTACEFGNYQIFLMCFPIDCPKSHDTALQMSKMIRQYVHGKNVNFAITHVAMNCELREDGDCEVLSRSEMKAKAEAHGASYVETSCIYKKNTDLVFELFAHGTEIVFDDDDTETAEAQR